MTEIASADESAVAKAQRELEAAGVRTVIGTVAESLLREIANPAG